jgi:membrane-bound metal-dependent hydrolase YbcI (DUF457 family)
MLGKSHLMFGAAGWLVAGPGLLALTGNELGIAELGTGTIVASGAAMLPDLDHPQATVSRSLGPVSQTFAKYFAKALGGHRNGSHSLLFILALGLLLHWALQSTDGIWVALGICLLASSLLFRTLTEASGAICFGLSAIMAIVLTTISPQMDWIFFAVLIGVLFHDLGDALTTEGVPPLWPINKTRVSVPVISRTGNGVEKVIAAVSGVVAAVLFVTIVCWPSWQSNQDQAQAAERPSGKANQHWVKKY